MGRIACWALDNGSCPLCGVDSPSKRLANEAVLLAALNHNMNEVSASKTYKYFQGKLQTKGSRAASNAHNRPDFADRVEADDGRYGSGGNGSCNYNYKLRGVYLFDFWYATVFVCFALL